MFHVERCRECGDVKPLDAVGKCRWRAGCEHRQMVHEARMGQLNAALSQLDEQRHWHVNTLRGLPTGDLRAPLIVDDPFKAQGELSGERAAMLAEWQRVVYEHVQELMVNGETWVNGQRWFIPTPDSAGEAWPVDDDRVIGPDTPDE